MASQHQLDADMAQFLDFTDAHMPDVDAVLDFPASQDVESGAFAPRSCPFHPNEICLCVETTADLPSHGFEINPPGLDPHLRVPKFHRPAVKCDRCRSAKLDCFFSYEEQKCCTSCVALFRPCSFTQGPSRCCVMDTLHPVDENQVIEQGSMTGIVALRSFNYNAATSQSNDALLTARKTGMRFSRANIKVLKDWMHSHNDHPYPTEKEKEKLCAKTGLTATQIANWLANTRRRAKQPLRSPSPHVGSSGRNSDAISIKPNRDGVTHRGKDWKNMNPLDRWKISPPEHEPARVEDIAYAVATTDLDGQPEVAGPSRNTSHRGLDSSGNSDSVSLWQAKSSASFDTGFSAISSGSFSNTSLVSSISHGSSRNSFGSRVSKDKRRRRRTTANPSRKLVDAKRMFECTFCTDRFKSKYDWARHEKSLHLSLEKWICSPIGEVIVDPVTGARKCVFCDSENPDAAHLASHGYSACEEKGLQARTFYRKDHLRQHLRLMHNCKMTPTMEAWKSEATFIKCRCGFCGARFERWADRVDHLAKHFRNGTTMKDWNGCRGFEPAVAAHVTNAMPPYLIAMEAKSPLPFSATNEGSMAPMPGGRSEAMESGYGAETTMGGIDSMFAFSRPSSEQKRSSSSTSTPPLSAGGSLSTPPMSLLPVQSNGSGIASCWQVLTNRLGSCWQVLTIRLGEFVRRRSSEQPDVAITDEELQREARIILYYEDDAWHQTAADNPEWLRLFRQAHGIPTEDMRLDRSVDPAEDLGVGEFSFDHFFLDGREDGGATQGVQQHQQISFGEDVVLPISDAEFAATMAVSGIPMEDFGFGGLEVGQSYSQLDSDGTGACGMGGVQGLEQGVQELSTGCLWDPNTQLGQVGCLQ